MLDTAIGRVVLRMPALPRHPWRRGAPSRLFLAALRRTLPVTGPDGRRGGWIQTYSGGRVWPMDLRTDDVRLQDVAHHLSMKARYAGACTDFLSVAQHAVELSRAVPGGPAVQYAALHHDDTEAFLPDIPSPVKPFIPGWRAIENSAERAIVIGAFGVDPRHLQMVKPFDRRIIADEVRAVMEPSEHPWRTRPIPLGLDISPWGPARAEQAYLDRHFELLRDMDR
jgi:hypothetical protein